MFGISDDQDDDDLEAMAAIDMIDRQDSDLQTNIFNIQAYGKGKQPADMFKHTPKNKKRILVLVGTLYIPSSPPSHSSPSFTNLQPTPVPSDLNIISQKKLRLDAQYSTIAIQNSLSRNQTGFTFESDSEDDENLSLGVSNQKDPNICIHGGILDVEQYHLNNIRNFKSDTIGDRQSTNLACDTQIDTNADVFNDLTRVTLSSSKFNHAANIHSQASTVVGYSMAQNTDQGSTSKHKARSTKPDEIVNFLKLPRSNAFIRARSSSGLPLFFPNRKVIQYDTLNDQTGSLLSGKIHKLMATVATNIKNRMILEDNEQEILKVGRHKQSDSSMGIPEEKKLGSNRQVTLWVDKYSPRNYVDLVGDERTNKLVLSWVKEWDFCVFKKERKDQRSKKSKIVKFEDCLHRPDRKILLVSGPPGLGKTSLVHVVARHSGYNVVEINASDERTATVFKSKILNAIECKDVFGQRKPNLIIIDEIDGISTSSTGESNFINLLIKLVDGKSKYKKGNSRQKELMRPIVCICNDAYVPALKSLRSVAEVIHMKSISYQSLAKRLYEICNWEGLNADLKTMINLCEITQGDLRSSINTLQFLQNDSPTAINKQIQSSVIGTKDISHSWLKICESVFKLSTPVMLKSEQSTGKSDQNIKRIIQFVDLNGDHEKIMQTCFENYLSINVFEVRGSNSQIESRSVQQGHYNTFYDTIQTKIKREQNFELMKYLSYPIANYQRLYSISKPVDIRFPNEVYLYDSIRKNLWNEVLLFWSKASFDVKTLWSNHTQNIMVLLPHLLQIISPEQKLNNIRLIKGEEKVVFDRVVHLLINFGIKLIKSRTEMNTFVYKLEPSINDIVDLPPYNHYRKTILDLPYTLNQTIAREVVEIEGRMKQRVLEKKDQSKKIDEVEETEKLDDITSIKENNTNRMIQLMDLVPISKPLLAPKKPRKDFFGRVVASKDHKESHQLISIDVEDVRVSQKDRGRYLYKFKEGYSNAVRKPLFMRDLQW